MNVETLRVVRNARPFRPFEIRTGSGEAYAITHPEVFNIAPDGTTAVVFRELGRVHILDVESITEVTTFPSGRLIGPDDEPDITA